MRESISDQNSATGLLTFYLTAVAGHEAFGTECLLVLGVDLNQCAGDSQTQSLALAGVTATLQVNLDIILLCYVQQVQGLLYYVLQNGAGEVLGQVTLVDGNLTATLLNIYAGYGAFAASWGKASIYYGSVPGTFSIEQGKCSIYYRHTICSN